MSPRIPGYQLGDSLGAGGAGSIYRATRESDGAIVALKLIETTGERADEMAKRAQQEACLTWAINHPNVVRVISWGFHDTGVHIAQELLTGETLGERLRRSGPLGVRATLHVTRQILRGLAAVHARGAVHRDIKPDNIFLADEHAHTVVKLLDLGVARLAEGDPSRCFETARGFTVGTPGYMAPEQIMGDTVDARTDLYALGVVVFECLTNELPVSGPSPEALAIATMKLREPPPLPPEVPHGLKNLVARLMSNHANARLDSVEAALAAIESLEGQTTAHVQTTVVLDGTPTLIGDLTVPRLGDWSGHRRFREYLLKAVLRLFAPGQMPGELTALFRRAESLEAAVAAARVEAEHRMREAGELARTWNQRATEMQEQVDARNAARTDAREAYVQATVQAEVDAAVVNDLDRAYGAKYRELEAAQVRAMGGAGTHVPLQAMLGDDVAQRFAELDALQRRREAQVQRLDGVRSALVASRGEVAAADAHLIEARGRLVAVQGRQRMEVDTAELRAREAEVELMRLEQACEHAYLRAGVMVQAELSHR